MKITPETISTNGNHLPRHPSQSSASLSLCLSHSNIYSLGGSEVGVGTKGDKQHSGCPLEEGHPPLTLILADNSGSISGRPPKAPGRERSRGLAFLQQGLLQ